MKPHQLWLSLVLIAGLISLSACGASTPAPEPGPAPTTAPADPTSEPIAPPTEAPTQAPTPTTAPATEPIVIGVLVDAGNLAPYGEEVWRGLQLGLRYATDGRLAVAGRPLQLLREEVAAADTAIAAVNRLASEQAALLVGPVGSNSAITVSGLIEGIVRGGLVYFATSGAPRLTAENWSPNLFRLCAVYPADGPIIPATAQAAVTTQFFGNRDVPALSPDSVGQVGLLPYHYAFLNNAANEWLVEQYRAEYGTSPDVDTECGFATGQAIVAGPTATGGESAAAQLIPALEGLAFDGPRGAYQIRAEDHQGLAPVFIVRLANTSDPEQKYFELLQEIPGAESGLPCAAAACP